MPVLLASGLSWHECPPVAGAEEAGRRAELTGANAKSSPDAFGAGIDGVLGDGDGSTLLSHQHLVQLHDGRLRFSDGRRSAVDAGAGSWITGRASGRLA
jgi:hypothetical protein